MAEANNHVVMPSAESSSLYDAIRRVNGRLAPKRAQNVKAQAARRPRLKAAGQSRLESPERQSRSAGGPRPDAYEPKNSASVSGRSAQATIVEGNILRLVTDVPVATTVILSAGSGSLG